MSGILRKNACKLTPQRLARETGFAKNGYLLEFNGHCRACLDRESKERKAV
jgi:hypothetical protein